MLVLSRRPGEKVLFPGVGISVEIIRSKGNTVRIGIEAPEDIRIIRGELEPKVSASDSPNSSPGLMALSQMALTDQSEAGEFNDSERQEIQVRLDEISMALALAQNQQQQGLDRHVGFALEQALNRLGQLKDKLQPKKLQESAVFESRSGYSLQREQLHLELDFETKSGFRMEFDCAV